MVQGPKKRRRIKRRRFWEVLDIRTAPKSCPAAQASGRRRQSTVDRNDRTTDEAAGSRGEVDGNTREVVRMSHAFHGRVIDNLLRAMLIDRVRHFRREVTRRNRIDCDMLR